MSTVQNALRSATLPVLATSGAVGSEFASKWWSGACVHSAASSTAPSSSTHVPSGVWCRQGRIACQQTWGGAVILMCVCMRVQLNKDVRVRSASRLHAHHRRPLATLDCTLSTHSWQPEARTCPMHRPILKRVEIEKSAARQEIGGHASGYASAAITVRI